MQSAITDFISQTVVDPLTKKTFGTPSITCGSGVKALRVVHLKFRERVDHHRFFLEGQKSFGCNIQRQNPCIKFSHFVDKRLFQMQTWLNVSSNNATKFKQHSAF